MAVVPASSLARHTHRLVSASPGRLVDPAGRLGDRQPGRGDRGVGPADPGPHRRQAGQLAGRQVLDRGVHRGPGHPDVHRRVAGHQPLRHQLGHQQREPLDAAEQRVGRHLDVQVQVVRAGGAHAERVPGRLDRAARDAAGTRNCDTSGWSAALRAATR